MLTGETGECCRGVRRIDIPRTGRLAVTEGQQGRWDGKNLGKQVTLVLETHISLVSGIITVEPKRRSITAWPPLTTPRPVAVAPQRPHVSYPAYHIFTLKFITTVKLQLLGSGSKPRKLTSDPEA